MKNKLINISKAAEMLGVSMQTLRLWEEKGQLVPKRTPNGHRRYSLKELESYVNIEEEENENQKDNNAIIYARVSTQKQADAGNLLRQIERLTDYAMKKGYSIVSIQKDIASGLNENRTGLQKVLMDIQKQKASVVLIEYKDRLARFGFSYLEKYIHAFSSRIEMMDEIQKEENQELVEDLIAITTSFSARIYGKRGGRKIKKIVSILNEGDKDENNFQNKNEYNG